MKVHRASFGRLGVHALWIFCCLLHCSSLAQRAPTEFDVKAAFLFNFLKYIEWPADKQPPPGGEFLIAIYGENPFGPSLRSIEGKEVKGRKVRFILTRQTREVFRAHIVFISRTEQPWLPSLVKEFQGKAILTVGDMDNFASKGGMIQFTMQDDSVKLVGDQAFLQRQEFKISSNLLNLIRKEP